MATEDVRVERFLDNPLGGRLGVQGRNAASPVPPNGRDGRAPLSGPRGPYASNLPNGSNGNNAQNQQNSSNGVNGIDSPPGADASLQYAKVWSYGSGYSLDAPVTWNNNTIYVITPQNNEIDLDLTRTYSLTTIFSTTTSGILVQKSGNYYMSLSSLASLGSVVCTPTVNGTPVNGGMLTLNAGDVVSAELSSSSWGASWYVELSLCQV